MGYLLWVSVLAMDITVWSALGIAVKNSEVFFPPPVLQWSNKELKLCSMCVLTSNVENSWIAAKARSAVAVCRALSGWQAIIWCFTRAPHTLQFQHLFNCLADQSQELWILNNHVSCWYLYKYVYIIDVGCLEVIWALLINPRGLFSPLLLFLSSFRIYLNRLYTNISIYLLVVIWEVEIQSFFACWCWPLLWP